jgi:hypothetical protein
MRADHRQIPDAAMNQWLHNRSTSAAMAELEAARVPAERRPPSGSCRLTPYGFFSGSI